MTRQRQSSWEVIFYETSQGARPAEEWLKEQGPKVGARFGRVFDLLEEYGTNVKGPYVAHVRGKLWEVRVEREKVQRRLLYFTALGRKFVILHGYVKKTQKAPPKEIEVAEQRMKDCINRWARAQRKQGR